MAPPIALCDYVYMAILSLDSITYHAVRCSISQKERYATTQPTQSITNQDTFCGTCHAITLMLSFQLYSVHNFWIHIIGTYIRTHCGALKARNGARGDSMDVVWSVLKFVHFISTNIKVVGMSLCFINFLSEGDDWVNSQTLSVFYEKFQLLKYVLHEFQVQIILASCAPV